MRSIDIGQISGKILVFGGVYSNLQALQALKLAADKHAIAADHIFCTGDIVAYCAQPAECLALVQDWGIHTIKGNVELNLLDDADDCGCNFSEGGRCDLFSRQWYPFAKSKMTPAHLDYIRSIPELLRFSYHGKQVLMLHGTIDNISGYIFKSTPWEEKQAIFDQADADIILAGHCGLPFYDQQADHHWINAGVIGMPANDGNATTWYATIDYQNDQLIVDYHTLAYDHTQAAKLMRTNNLPDPYATTLETGIWDNCEILPDEESRMQGSNLMIC